MSFLLHNEQKEQQHKKKILEITQSNTKATKEQGHFTDDIPMSFLHHKEHKEQHQKNLGDDPNK